MMYPSMRVIIWAYGVSKVNARFCAVVVRDALTLQIVSQSEGSQVRTLVVGRAKPSEAGELRAVKRSDTVRPCVLALAR